MDETIIAVLKTINQLLTSGIAITAFSLLLYGLTLNLRDRVARSFAFILGCMTTVFVGDAISSITTAPVLLEIWLRLQWVGIVFLPAVYLYLSDALLATTGLPAGRRRRWIVRLALFISLVFLAMLPSGLLVDSLVRVRAPAPYLERTTLTWIFTGFYVIIMAWSWVNFWRAFQRTTTSTSRRRMLYLMAGATAPALGSFPFLIFGYAIAASHPLLFWLTAVTSNLLTGVLLVIMAYSVAFFGVDWPDRVVKRRLFKWLMRGPMTASIVLVTTTLIRQIGRQLGFSYAALEIIFMVATILIMQYLISMVGPNFERWLFHRSDYTALRTLQTLEERLLTTNDLRQFLEAVLIAACDRLQSSDGFIATLVPPGLEMTVTVGNPREEQIISPDLIDTLTRNGEHEGLFSCGGYWIMPLYSLSNNGEPSQALVPPLLGLMGLIQPEVKVGEISSNVPATSDEQYNALELLAQRATIALEDLYVQQKLLNEMQDLTPQVDMIQRLRAASRYDGSSVLTTPELPAEQKVFSKWVKDALDHYWGGPKLTQSPLLILHVVQDAIQEGDSPPNALRNVLRNAIEQIRPEGERHFTAEWILYNILEMKFLEGHKVRDVAMRLAVSEADFYRKQRTGIKAIAKIISEMEEKAIGEAER
ncbi:MAG: hypothetical protein MUO64_12255 [Anaerolineales bacterium]|nr:hypothetical protein [Anaerolineales bacterium]